MESQTQAEQDPVARKGRKRNAGGVIGGAIAKSAERAEPSFDSQLQQADLAFDEKVAQGASLDGAAAAAFGPPPETPPQPPEAAPSADGPPPRKRRSRVKPALLLLLLMLLSLAAWWVVDETRTSAMQAKFFSQMARKSSWKVEPGPSNAIRFPSDSPYDERLGYANIPDYLAKLKSHDYVVTAQSRMSPKMVELADMGVFATYREKTRVGLDITDSTRQPIFSARFPERVYDNFASTPTPLVTSLLFIANRELLDPTYAKRNPAVEWDPSAWPCSTSPCTRSRAATSASPGAAPWPPKLKNTATRRTAAPPRSRTSCARCSRPPCAPTRAAKTPPTRAARSWSITSTRCPCRPSSVTAKSTASATACGSGTGATSPPSTRP